MTLQAPSGLWGPALTNYPLLEGAVNKPLAICCLVGAALGITLGLAVFDSPFLGFALGLGVGAVVGAGIGSRR